MSNSIGKIPFVPQESIGESLGDIDQVKNPMKLLPLWRMKLAPKELPNIAK